MRAYLVINAGDFWASNKDALKKLKVNLNKSTIDHRWVPEESLHISLLSLGDMGRDTLTLKENKIKEVVEQHKSFSLKLEGVWAYPEQMEARLLWIAVQNSKNLRALRDDLIDLREDPEEKEFKPIFPIVRFRNHRNVTDIISPFKNASFGELVVKKIDIIEMVSGGAYPTYKTISSFDLTL